MGNIVWAKPDGTIALTSLVYGDSPDHAKYLQNNKIVDPSWSAVLFDTTLPAPIDSCRWNGKSIGVVESRKSAPLTQMGAFLQTIFPRIIGSFTLNAATSTIVTQPAIAANSVVLLTPTNATAALIVRTNGLYHAANTPGASFTLSTQSGSAVAGGTFAYIVINPS